MAAHRSEPNFKSNRREFLRSSSSMVALTGALAMGATVTLATTPLVPASAAAAEAAMLPVIRVKQELVAPPFLPEHDQVATGGPKIVEVTLVIEEKKMVLDDDGTEVWALHL